jgi:transformation/transcription domain-associated protein
MLTIITRQWPDLISDQRKQVIRFGWSSISDPDATVKHVGYGLTAHFLAKIESPAKVCIFTYTGLLRSHAPDARPLAREALDVLVPVMPARMAGSMGSGPGAQDWLAMTRRIIADEGHNSLPLLAHIYQTFARHPDVYYPRRDYFLGNIVSSLPKFSLAPQAATENRMLAVELIELIMRWERRRLDTIRMEEGSSRMDVDGADDTGRASPKRVRLDRSGSAAPSTTSAGTSGIPPPPSLQIRDSVVSTLIRIIHSSPEVHSKSGTNVPSRALALLHDLIGPEVWPDVSLKIGFFQVSTFSVNLAT